MSGLLDGLRDVLVDDGPLDHLHFYELPSRQYDDVDVSATPIGGLGASFVYGKRGVSGGAAGVVTDAGVNMWQSGVLFTLRAARMDRPDGIIAVLDAARGIRDRLVQIRWTSVVHAGEILHNLLPDAMPALLADTSAKAYRGGMGNRHNRDAQGRVYATMQCEAWHGPDWTYDVDVYVVTDENKLIVTDDGKALVANIPVA